MVPPGPAGTALVSLAGEVIGTVENAATETVRSPRYAIAALDGRLGLDDKLFVLPWQILQFDPVRRCFTLGVEEERLIGAPAFDRDRRPDLSDPVLRHAVHVHFGDGEVPPPAGAVSSRPPPSLRALASRTFEEP